MQNIKNLFIRYAKFAASTLAGTFVDTLVLFFFSHYILTSYIGKTIISPTISFECAVFTNYVMAYLFVWKDRIAERNRRDFCLRFLGYNVSCVAGFLVKMVLLVATQLITHLDVVYCNLIALCFSGILNFALNEFLIFGKKKGNADSNEKSTSMETLSRKDFRFTKSEYSLTLALCLLFSIPSCYRVFLNGSDNVIYLAAVILSTLPLAYAVQSIRRRWVFISVMVFLLISPFVETFLIVVYHDFIRTGNLLSTATTTKRESGNFFANNVKILLYEIPVVIAFASAIWLRWRMRVRARINIIMCAAGIVLCLILGLLGHRVLGNPPYNIYMEAGHAVYQQVERRVFLPQGENMKFEAKREKTTTGREIYIMGVGESLRYDHTSLGGYDRNTTPELAANTNLVSFSNYYSTATLTFYSVPMMLSRATSKNFNLHYKEKSIVEPYKECGFKVFVISCKKLLANEPYITRGADSIYSVSRDKDIPVVVDSLSHIYPKTLFIVQMLQCHSYYNNFEPQFDKFHPNLVSDPDVKDKNLYLNAYDNTVLYTDHIISTLLKTIDQPDVQSAFLFASDHGEILTMKGSRRGNSLTPSKDEYHVPMLFWYSNKWAENHPDKLATVKSHANEAVNADNLFYSACDMADITLPAKYAKTEWSIFSPTFETHKRKLLLPDGRSILNQDKKTR